ncbi:MAG: zinc-dependent peptidase [Steroidobacteraceae bacterium]
MSLSTRAIAITNAAFALVVLLHADRAPAWCSVIALAIVCWRQFAAQRGLPVAGTLLRVVVTLGLTALVVLNFRTLNGLEAGSALLIVMGAAKLLELRDRRDASIVIAVALFLLLAACLQRQDLTRVPLYAASAWLSCTALAALAGRSTTLRAAAGSSGRALLYALPLACLAFVLVPRLPGSLWAIPGNSKATTGLSEEMSPGSITDLTESDDPAFRVRFLEATPPPQERYWRGPVLHEFDGYTWRRLRSQYAPTPAARFEGPVYRQRIMLEPNQRNWWFGLDTVRASPRRGVYLTFDGQLVTDREVTQAVSYELDSQTSWVSTGPLSVLARRFDTALPAGRNRRTLQLARELRAANPDPQAFAAAMLEHLRTGGFEYTLTPPRLDYDSIDDLLFNTKLGFCGHFASAFATVMRGGGVPARVVTGYLGGEWNPVGGYFIVRQSDAHAWTEVWFEGRGWTRIDPTAVVSPERLTRGAYELLSESDSRASRLLRSSPWLLRMRSMWDAGNTWWRDRIIEFNLDSQLALLERLGIRDPDWRTLATLLTAGIVIWLALLTWQLRRAPRSATRDALTRAWQVMDRRLARAGVPRQSHEPVPAHIERAARALALQGPRLRALARRYSQLRYGPHDARWDSQVAGLRAAAAKLPLRPMPGLDAGQDALLRTQLPVYARLPSELRERCGILTRQLLQRLRFVGCNGLELTATMRLVIGFQACLMLANRGIDAYGDLASVLVYPDQFVVQESDVDEAGVVTEGTRALSGQSIDTARIVLSWRDVLDSIAGEEPGYNVVLHEFAHHLDHSVDGLLSSRTAHSTWHDVLTQEYDALCDAVDADAPTLIDPYAAEDPAEFFAVITETFFELPYELAAQHARLYELLREFYDLDPREWVDPAYA